MKHTIQLLLLFAIWSATASSLENRLVFQVITDNQQFETNADVVREINQKYNMNLELNSTVLKESKLYKVETGTEGQSVGVENIVFSSTGFPIYHQIKVDLPGIFGGELLLVFGLPDDQAPQLADFQFGDKQMVTVDDILTTGFNGGIASVIGSSGQLGRFEGGHAQVRGFLNQDSPFIQPGVLANGDFIWVIKQ